MIRLGLGRVFFRSVSTMIRLFRSVEKFRMATYVLERREQLRPVLKAAVDAEALKRAACTMSSLGERPCWSG